MSAKYQIIYWRDIPSQVKIKIGRKRMSEQLSERFIQSIDAAAMRSGDTDTDEYLAEWRQTEWQDVEGEPQAFLKELVAKLEADYPGKRLSDLVKNEGRNPAA